MTVSVVNEKRSSSTIHFADVALQTLSFDVRRPAEKLVLDLVDTRWVQRLRRIRQTGNTHLVYMFSEHSRFGHSLGVAYLALLLMRRLEEDHPQEVRRFESAVAAAALLHDVGHVAPGSHLGERVWNHSTGGRHEALTSRIIESDQELQAKLKAVDPNLPEMVRAILNNDSSTPPWTRSILSGGGWNADRGNWAIVDSAMCSVTYGRYNVTALIDAFKLSTEGELVLTENRLDALTHFFVARDSMYRQVYQHRVLQTVDRMTELLVRRLRELLGTTRSEAQAKEKLSKLGVSADKAMVLALLNDHQQEELGLETIFWMTESWWDYHLQLWCNSEDRIVCDLAQRLRDRNLFKTVRLSPDNTKANVEFIQQAESVCKKLGYQPDYYLIEINDSDRHRDRIEDTPKVLLDSGQIVLATEIEPLIAKLSEPPIAERRWLAVPKEVKEQLGRLR